jgi:hypothetical protein
LHPKTDAAPLDHPDDRPSLAGNVLDLVLATMLGHKMTGESADLGSRPGRQRTRTDSHRKHKYYLLHHITFSMLCFQLVTGRSKLAFDGVGHTE